MVIAVWTHAPVAVSRIRTLVTEKKRNDAHDHNRTPNTPCHVWFLHGKL